MGENLFGQRKVGIEDVNYRRSSLYTVLLESAEYPLKEQVENTFVEAPFPDKYNMHVVGPKTFNPTMYGGSLSLDNPDLGNKRMKAGTAGNIEDQRTIENFLTQEGIGRKMVARWFNRSENGGFDMNLIAERGFYDASEMAKQIAAGTARGSAALGDAGEELIGNTFIVAQKLNFVENEPFALAIREIAYATAAELESDLARDITKAAADVLYAATKDGYSAVAVAYLFQLVWNDSVAAVFYQDMWVDGNNPDPERVRKFDESQIFKLRFVGAEKANSTVLLSAGRTMEEIIHLTTIRNIDNVYTRLQKKYDVFKTKTPIYSMDPLSAKIGKKEGLKGGEKFEVLEQTVDAKTGRTKYVRKGVVTVDKQKIWDNRYLSGKVSEPESSAIESAAPEPVAEGETSVDENGAKIGSIAPSDQNPTDSVSTGLTAVVSAYDQPDLPADVTYFKGGSKKYYSGMLIRQIK